MAAHAWQRTRGIEHARIGPKNVLIDDQDTCGVYEFDIMCSNMNNCPVACPYSDIYFGRKIYNWLKYKKKLLALELLYACMSYLGAIRSPENRTPPCTAAGMDKPLGDVMRLMVRARLCLSRADRSANHRHGGGSAL